MINVTKTFLPPLDEYTKLLEQIWESKWIANRGQLYQKLVIDLKQYLSVDYIIPMTNGTLPIQIALNAYGHGGEIITTPFSYVATTSSIVWENCKPVFVDIHPEYLTIDETKIERAITEKTTAILATHVYGNPCNIEAIEHIAQKHQLKVIYDAAHCFGVKYKGQSIFNFGNVSVCSFHATKIFHTGEGGALFCTDEDTYHEMFYRHNFGHDGPMNYHGLGINAKMSELQAAMGLSVLKYIDDIFSQRRTVCEYYEDNLNTARLKMLKIRANTDWNYSYFPVVFETEMDLLKVERALNENNVYPRRYFYPSLTELPYILDAKTPIAEDIAKRVMCLPLYVGLEQVELDSICKLILGALRD